MLRIEFAQGELRGYELAVLERCADTFLLPLTCVSTDAAVSLLYATEGYVPLREYDFRGDLMAVFRTVRGYVRCLCEAQDMLLAPERVFRSGDRVFMRARDGAVRVVYGRIPPAHPIAAVAAAKAANEEDVALPDADISRTGEGGDILLGAKTNAALPADRETAFGAYTAAVLPVLGELSELSDVIGAKSAMIQIAKKIRAANPAPSAMLKIIEVVERRWNYMQQTKP